MSETGTTRHVNALRALSLIIALLGKVRLGSCCTSGSQVRGVQGKRVFRAFHGAMASRTFQAYESWS